MTTDDDHLHVVLKADAPDYSFIPEYLIQGGFRVTKLNKEHVRLEDIFMKVTKGIVS